MIKKRLPQTPILVWFDRTGFATAILSSWPALLLSFVLSLLIGAVTAAIPGVYRIVQPHVPRRSVQAQNVIGPVLFAGSPPFGDRDLHGLVSFSPCRSIDDQT